MIEKYFLDKNKQKIQYERLFKNLEENYDIEIQNLISKDFYNEIKIIPNIKLKYVDENGRRLLLKFLD